MKLSQNLALITLSIFVSGQTALAIKPTSKINQKNQSNPKTLLLAKEEIESAEPSVNNQQDREATSEDESQPEEESAKVEEEKEAQPTPEEIARQQKFIEADRFYLAGNKIAAAKIYRQLKKPWDIEKTKITKKKQAPSNLRSPKIIARRKSILAHT